MADELNLSSIAKEFQDESDAYKLFERIRWPDGPVCPHCGSIDNAYFLEPKNGARKTRTGSTSARRVWKCAEKACRKQFSVLKGTIFEDSKIPLSKWLLAFYLLCSNKNGTAEYELHRILKLDRKTAWFLTMRVRHAMAQEPLASKLQGIVEADETYFGAEAKFMHANKRAERFANGTLAGKVPVFSLVERGGEVRSQVIRTVTSKNTREALTENVDATARLRTDQATVCVGPGREFAAHETVDHGAGEYARGDAYRNTAEGYFSQLKRSVDGNHHLVSNRHLSRYRSSDNVSGLRETATLHQSTDLFLNIYI